jgi:outer membrane lipoprotein LolB
MSAMFKNLPGGILLLLALLSGGCASQRPVEPQFAPQFVLNGRISINHQGERHSSGLHWTHTAQSDEMLLLTPLGQTAARVYRDAQHATLDNGEKHYQANDVETLMQQMLGWHLPVAQLHQWVLGVADNGSPAEILRDENGQLTLLRQNGWEIRYLRYNDADKLPARMQLNLDGLQMQLLIDDWVQP